MKLIADHESEHRVISAMLHAQSDDVYTTALIDLQDNDFDDPFAMQMFQLIDSIYREGNAKPTLVEVMKEGHKLGCFDKQEDRDQLRDISSAYVDDENIDYWADKVREASKGRKAQKLLTKYTQTMENTTDIDSLISTMGSEFFSLSLESRASKIDSGKDIAELGREEVKRRIKKYRDNIEACKLLGTVPLDGVATGLPTLDRLTLGYKPGDLIILAAQTGHGKTAFALHTANAVSVQNGDSLGYVNTEMSREQIALRWGAILSSISLQQIREGSLTNVQAKQVYEAYKKLEESGFHAETDPNLTPRRMKEIAQKMKMQHRIKLMILDYVGRMDTSKEEKEWLALYNIIKQQKIMAQNLEIANMVLVQLNPDSSLQGAKRMKNECDIMMKFELVEKEEKVHEIQKYRGKKFETFNSYIILEKSRDSASGIYIPICFDKERQQMREADVVGEFRTADFSDLGRKG